MIHPLIPVGKAHVIVTSAKGLPMGIADKLLGNTYLSMASLEGHLSFFMEHQYGNVGTHADIEAIIGI